MMRAPWLQSLEERIRIRYQLSGWLTLALEIAIVVLSLWFVLDLINTLL